MDQTLTAGWPLLVGIGCFSGLASGLLGIGGGTIIVPALVFALPLLGIDGAILPMIAIATSVAIIIPTAIASAQQHQAKGSIDWYFVLLLAPSIILGSFIAGYFAHAVDPRLLSLLFVCYALHTAKGMLRRPNTAVLALHDAPSEDWSRSLTAAAVGASGGAVSSLTGLGNAFYTVPFMSKFIEMKRAIGTAATLNIPLAISGVAGYVIADRPAECGQACIGFVHLPAVAAISITAVLLAPIGARMTQIVPVLLLRRAFGVILIGSAANLAVKTLPLQDAPSYIIALAKRVQISAVAHAPIAAEPPSCLADPTSRLSSYIATYGPRRTFETIGKPCPSSSELAMALLMLRERPSLPKDYWVQQVVQRELPAPLQELLPPKPRPGERPRSRPKPTRKTRVTPRIPTKPVTVRTSSLACGDEDLRGVGEDCVVNAKPILQPSPPPTPKKDFDPFGEL